MCVNETSRKRTLVEILSDRPQEEEEGRRKRKPTIVVDTVNLVIEKLATSDVSAADIRGHKVRVFVSQVAYAYTREVCKCLRDKHEIAAFTGKTANTIEIRLHAPEKKRGK